MVRDWWVATALGILLVPGVAAADFSRSYESATVIGDGDPLENGTVAGTGVCAGGQDRLFDSAACLNYYVPTASIDFRGQRFTVTMADAVHGENAAALVQFDLDEDGDYSCIQPDVCHFGRGVITGIVPDAGRMLKVVPFAIHRGADGTVSQASAGEVLIDFDPVT